MPEPRKGGIPRELTLEEIDVIVRAFHAAACRVKNAGFDGVEIHSAHGYLLNQFLSPLTNKRRDDYGGDIRNRIHFHLQVIESVHAAVGNDFPIFLRLGASDFTAGGTTIEDSQIAAQEFEKVGIDVLDISDGFCGYSIPSIYSQGYFAPISEAIKQLSPYLSSLLVELLKHKPPSSCWPMVKQTLLKWAGLYTRIQNGLDKPLKRLVMLLKPELDSLLMSDK